MHNTEQEVDLHMDLKQVFLRANMIKTLVTVSWHVSTI